MKYSVPLSSHLWQLFPQFFYLLTPCGGMVGQARREPGITMTRRQQAKLTEASCSGLRVSPVVRLLEAIKNWKAAEFGRAGRKPRGRV